MASIKPDISAESVLRILKNEADASITEIVEIASGQIARTYEFNIGDKDYFIQFNAPNMAQGFRTEVHYSNQFQSCGVPVRKILKTGEGDGLDYLISEKAEGRGFHENGRDEFIAALPSVLDALANIARVETKDSAGFGWLDEKMNGAFASWAGHLMQIRDEEPGFFYGNWHRLFETTFLERETFDRYFTQMENLLPRLPSLRNLVHGGYGYGNVLTLDRRVTAILDWQDARYGDPLFDLAYMIFWHEPGLAALITREYQRRFSDFDLARENFDSRLACYKYYIGLDGMRFAAKTDDIAFYKSVLKVLERVTDKP